MGELGLNKIFGALLATALGIIGLREVSAIVFDKAGHHGAHEPASLNEWAEENFAYFTEIAEAAGGEVVEEIFDLGLILASADVARGEQSMRGKCASCHTWDEGGSNGTGPNLHGIVGADIAGVSGFGYSAAFTDYPGTWTYEELNGFLLKPSSHIRGTAMSFNGLSKDNERAAVIAFLAAQTPNAPAFPDPLPAVEASDEVIEGEAVLEETSLEDVTDGAVEAVTEAVETVADDTIEATEGASDLVEDVIDEVTETVDNAAEDVVDGE